MSEYYVRKSTSNNGRQVFHTNKSCQHLQRDPVTISTDTLERMDLRLCRTCDPAYTQDNSINNRSYYQLALSHD